MLQERGFTEKVMEALAMHVHIAAGTRFLNDF